jgi:hypothetical protein
MKYSTKTCLALLGFLFVASAQAMEYVVKKGDTFASIARAHYGEPVFGPQGTINKIYNMNRWANAKVTLEPGQTIILEDKKKPSQDVAFTPNVLPEPEHAPESKGETEPAEPPKTVIHNEPIAPIAAKEDQTSHDTPMPQAAHISQSAEELPRNYFSVIPSYSQIQQSATETATGISYSINSNSAYGVELGWDHWWNTSFSTVLTYSILQMSSNEKGDGSSSPVIDNLSLTHTELALLNRLGHVVRLGLGLAYGDHIFLEQFSDTPPSPKIYKTAFFNPFLSAEITAYETHRFELLGSAKISALPAQVGNGQDLRNGTEYFAQLALLQKLDKWSLLYGISYASEDQTRTDATETRTEWALKLGALF